MQRFPCDSHAFACQNSSVWVRDTLVFNGFTAQIWLPRGHFSQISLGQDRSEIPRGSDKTGPHPSQQCYSLHLWSSVRGRSTRDGGGTLDDLNSLMLALIHKKEIAWYFCKCICVVLPHCVCWQIIRIDHWHCTRAIKSTLSDCLVQ